MSKEYIRKVKETKPVVAICYDFDKTLTPDDMQSQGFIQKLGYDKVRFSEFKIQNIVGSCDVKFQISLEGLSAGTKSSSYEPEIFPGLIFKMLQPKIVLLIFVSGKIVLTGAKEKEEIFEAFKKIYPVLQRYKKKTFEKTNDTTSDQGKGEEH